MIRLTCLLLLVAGSLQTASSDELRPNFVLLLSEDNSVHYMNLYGNSLATTPAIESLAKAGVVYDHAFSCSPVCSVARTTLMTGMFAPRVGSQFHRKLKLAQLPDGAKLFPAYLRDAGYYTSNNAKKDYNVVEGKVWDESSRRASWRKRPDKKTPFLHMQSISLCHESSLHFKAMDPATLTTPPKSVKLPPYHPDTPTMRYTHARYVDRIKLMDAQIKKIVNQLGKDGLLEDTFIFYMGDHGGVLPRSKGYIYESGLHVPMVVRVPERWRQKVHVKTGTRRSEFVNFTDISATILNLAGLPIPAHLNGRPFLGPNVTSPKLESWDEAFGYADRFDERYELCRSLRKGKFKYIRNYQSYYPDSLQNNYRYKMLAFEEWRTLFKAGKLNAQQRQFFEPKPVELLFDVDADPHEVNNLASDPSHLKTLEEMRKRLQGRMRTLPDLSLFPESELVSHALPDAMGFGKKQQSRIAKLLNVADLALEPFDKAKPKLLKELNSQDPLCRYWALNACCCFGAKAKELANAIKAKTHDPHNLVALKSAEFLAMQRLQDPTDTLYRLLAATDSPVEALMIMNSVVHLHDMPNGYSFDTSRVHLKVGRKPVVRRLEYLENNR